MFVLRDIFSGASVSKLMIFASGVMLVAGVGYRVASSRLSAAMENRVELPVPLSEFPIEFGGWAGEDVPIPRNIQQAAGNDDFLSRMFEHKATGHRVNLYVAYSGRPRTMLGHRPRVCYVSNGWVWESSVESRFVSSGGKSIPCLIHRFYKPGFAEEEVVVLNFYILNGQVTSSESGFSGLKWRSPNISGDPARYVAQVQISAVLENLVLSLAEEMTDLILDFFPDTDVHAAVRESVLGVRR